MYKVRIIYTEQTCCKELSSVFKVKIIYTEGASCEELSSVFNVRSVYTERTCCEELSSVFKVRSVYTEQTCCEELSSVFRVHCTAAGNASFMRAADRGTGDDLTRVSNMSKATCQSQFIYFSTTSILG